MSSRGRGRGRGAKRTFNREQLNALGVVGNEPIAQLANPPPLYTPLLRSAVPIEPSQDLDYALALKQDFVNYMQLSYSHLKMSENAKDGDQDKLKMASKDVIPDWRMFPIELRPMLKAKRRVKVPKKKGDIIQKLNKLEEAEDKPFDIEKIKTEPNADDDEDDENAQEEEEEEQMDEDLDDGTDYGNNYFDNGDSYCNDEDDNLDDGPIY